LNNILDFTTKMLGFQGIEVVHTNVNSGIFYIFAKPSHILGICPECGKIVETVHDVRVQYYKHLPMWEHETVLVLPIFRFQCDCDPNHPFTLSYDFIRKYQRQTINYEEYIYSLCRNNSIENVSVLSGLSSGTCQRLFNYYAQLEIDERGTTETEFLGIDEFAIKKGHEYNTVIYDLVTHRLVDVIEGRTKDDVMSYFSALSEDFKFAIKAVAMDMSRSYCNSVRESLPNAKPVIDRFHISQLLHKLIDEARKHIQNKIRKEEEDKTKVFGIRWALLKNFEDLSAKEMNTLLMICDEYPRLGECFALKEEFRKFFDIDNVEDAASFLDYYKELVIESQIPELQSFCKTIDNWREYILNYYTFKITNGPTEGLNSKIKTIKRRAYGYRNSDNFILRLKLECAA
jgi:transposase